jgi:hypothetical protein
MITSPDAACYGASLRCLKPDEPEGAGKTLRCSPEVSAPNLPPSRTALNDPDITENRKDVNRIPNRRRERSFATERGRGRPARRYVVLAVSVPRKVSRPRPGNISRPETPRGTSEDLLQQNTLDPAPEKVCTGPYR